MEHRLARDRSSGFLQSLLVLREASRLDEEIAMLAALVFVLLSVNSQDLDSKDRRRLVLRQQQAAIPLFRPCFVRRMVCRFAEGTRRIARMDAGHVFGHLHVSMGNIVHPPDGNSAQNEQYTQYEVGWAECRA